MKSIALVLLIAACLTDVDVRTSVCSALCRHDGADTGYFESKTKSCMCGFRTTYKEATEKKTYIHIAPKHEAEVEAPAQTYHFPEYFK